MSMRDDRHTNAAAVAAALDEAIDRTTAAVVKVQQQFIAYLIREIEILRQQVNRP